MRKQSDTRQYREHNSAARRVTSILHKLALCVRKRRTSLDSVTMNLMKAGNLVHVEREK